MSERARESKLRPPVYPIAGGVLVVLAGVWMLGALASLAEAVRTSPAQLNTWLMLLPIGALGLGIYWLVLGLRRQLDGDDNPGN